MDNLKFVDKIKEVFKIKVDGDSMINDVILDKEIVIVERCKTHKKCIKKTNWR